MAHKGLRGNVELNFGLGSIASSLLGTGAHAVKDAAGNSLTTFNQNLKVLLGDFNDDGVVSVIDSILIRNLINSHSYSIFADLNGDGVLDVLDYNLCRSRIGTHL